MQCCIVLEVKANYTSGGLLLPSLNSPRPLVFPIRLERLLLHFDSASVCRRAGGEKAEREESSLYGLVRRAKSLLYLPAF